MAYSFSCFFSTYTPLVEKVHEKVELISEEHSKIEFCSADFEIVKCELKTRVAVLTSF